LNACLRMLGGAFPVPDKPIDCQQTIIECMKAQLRTQNDPTYTLVLRDKRGVTMLIRGIIPRVVGVTFNGATNTPTDAQGNPITQSCERFAADLKVSPDIESAECFK
jgi:hypothetical protein